jgi:uncharacterized protein YijF (DUF1287 family)
MRRILAALSLGLAAGFACAGPATGLVAAAKTQIGVTIRYDPSYQRIAYPGGDVPRDRGVCTDVVVRAYRGIGIDLQQLVHRDMKKDWRSYPHQPRWGLKAPDPNIDHRRVPNLSNYFTRHGMSLPVTLDPRSYLPGDIVVWRVPPGLPHIGLVSDQHTRAGTPLVIHNIGSGTKMEDRLFSYTITGHYRFLPAAATR